MQQLDLYSEFGSLLSSTDVAQVLSGLRQDPFVWKNLENNQLWQAAVRYAGSQANRWTPGLLGLLSVGCTRTPEEMSAQPMIALDADLHEAVLQAFQNAQSGNNPATLQEAALLALALRERRRQTGNWNGLLSEIQTRAGQGSSVPQVWRTALACLMALIPDPEDLLRAMLPRNGARSTYEWLTHAQLCQPFSSTQHIQTFSHLLQGQSLSVQLGTLRSLALHGRTELTEMLAEALLVGHPSFTMLRNTTSIGDLDLAGVAARALTLQQVGALYQLAGNRSQSQVMLKSAEQAIKHWMAGLYLQEIYLDTCDDSPSPTGLLDDEKLDIVVRYGSCLKSELGALMTSLVCLDGVLEQLQAEHDDPFLQIKLAGHLAEEDNLAMAQDMARQGVADLLDTLARTGQPFSGDFVYAWHPLSLIQAILNLGLTHEALQLSLALYELRPTDTALAQHLSQMFEAQDDLPMACRYAQAAASQEPEKADWRRRLGRLRFAMGDWQPAYAEMNMVLALSNPPSLDDRLAYAQAALHIQAYDRAIETCDLVMSENPDNGIAAGLRGQAMVEMGNEEEALVFLSRATLLAPENLSPWLVLAALQQKNGEPARSLETLRSAVIAIPNAAEGHIALSQAYLAEGLLSEALPHLKQAFQLKPSSDSTAFLYGKTLRALGHGGEARSVLERTRPYWMKRPEMAYEYAQAALDQQDTEGAIPALEVALRAPQPPVDWYLLFARVLLNEDDITQAETSCCPDVPGREARYRQAEAALNRVLELNADHFEARFLLANLQLERNQLEDALAIFSELSETHAQDFAELHWRVQWGLGRAALRLGQIEIALGALEDASQSRPDNLALQRCLAEASLQAGFGREAQAAAEYALQLAPDRVENLVWFSDVMIALNEHKRAADALESAIELDPRHAELRIRLAHLQVSAGNSTGANASLAAVMDLPDVSSADLRQAANTYLRLENADAALACLDRSVAIDLSNTVQPPLEVMFKVASLHEQAGRLDKALELTQQALANPEYAGRVESLPVSLLQADVLGRLGHSEAALSALEKGLLAAPDVDGAVQLEDGLKKTLGQIHQAFTQRLIETGSLPAALSHAQQALELIPEDLPFRCQAVQLALNMLQTEPAEKLVLKKHLTSSTSPEALLLQALWIELALHMGKDAEARLQLAEALALAPGNARFLAIQVRLAAADGDLQAAQRLYQEVNLLVGENVQPAFWLAEAALAAQRWQEANRLFEAYLRLHPAEALAYLGLARSLVLAAEQQATSDLLQSRLNAPGISALSELTFQRLNETLQGLEERSSTAEVRRWQLRGQAAFQPDMQSARGLISYLHSPEDTAALVAVLRKVNNVAAAQQTARRHPEDPSVQLQYGLCFLGAPETTPDESGEDSPMGEGLRVAAHLAGSIPGQPLHHALLALLAWQAGDLEQALDGFEQALRIWPDEAGWHDAAGDLALELGITQAGMLHREQAWELNPNSVRAAKKLGQVCMAEGKAERAVSVLEKASQLEHENADIWLLLSRAYLLAQRLPQALEAALTSAEIEHLSAQGLLLAGETALAMDQLDQALDLGYGAVQREPENPAAYLFLCQVLDARNQPREALALLEEAGPSVRQNFAIAFERARLIHDLHGPQPALETLERLAQEYPEEPELLAFLSRTQAECGDLRMAERHAFKALRLNPNQPELALMLGRLQRKTGQLDQSLHLLSEAVRMAPAQLDAYLELGSVYQDRREFDQALQVYQQAIQVAPRDYQAYYRSGILLRDNKDYAGSEHMLRKAADLAPDNPSIRRQLIAVITLNLVHKK